MLHKSAMYDSYTYVKSVIGISGLTNVGIGLLIPYSYGNVLVYGIGTEYEWRLISSVTFTW